MTAMLNHQFMQSDGILILSPEAPLEAADFRTMSPKKLIPT